MTWREGYLQQAESEFSLYRGLNRGNRPICHQLHYLQMATGKLAKSYLYEVLCASLLPPLKPLKLPFGQLASVVWKGGFLAHGSVAPGCILGLTGLLVALA